MKNSNEVINSSDCYISPTVEMVYIQLESGFAISGDSNFIGDDLEEGGEAW